VFDPQEFRCLTATKQASLRSVSPHDDDDDDVVGSGTLFLLFPFFNSAQQCSSLPFFHLLLQRRFPTKLLQ